MKKVTLFLSMLALVLGFAGAKADVQSPYTYSFEGLSASTNDFAPSGWGHVVEAYYGDDDTYYVKYTPQTSGGYGDNGAYLSIGSQTIGSSASWDQETVHDMLVTPAVTGEVSLYVKQNKASGTVSFYTCTYNATTAKYVKGDQYEVTLPTLSESEWTKVTIADVPADTRLGICGDNVDIDEFTAESANIVLRKSVEIISVKFTNDDNVDASPEGKATLTANVVIKNNGDVDLTPGDENYSLTVVDYTANTDLATIPVSVALAAGETSAALPVSCEIDVTEYIRHRFDIKENLNSTTRYGAWFEIYPYAPSFTFETTNVETISTGDTQDFGIAQGNVTKNYYVRNHKGGAPLTISSITVPAGFSYEVLSDDSEPVALSTPFVVAPHGKATVNITMDAATVGSRSGNIVITPADGQGDAITLPVTGSIVDPSKLYCTYANGEFPAGTIVESSNWSIEKYTDGDGNYSTVNSNAQVMSRFILPKVRLDEGETFTFNAAKRGSASVLKIYYSADRVNWTLAQTITTDADDDANKFSNDTYTSSYWGSTTYKYKSFVPGIPAGEWYIAFESGYSRVGTIVGGTVLAIPEKEITVMTSSLPDSGIVNNYYTASATIANTGSADFAEGELTAKLYLDGTLASESPVGAIASGATASVSLNGALHTAGSVAVKLAIEGAATTELTTTATVAEETPSGEYQVGEAKTTNTNIPASLNYRNSDSEIIYPAEAIGLESGTTIRGISFKGFKNSSEQQLSTFAIWMENTSDSAPDKSNIRSTDEMIQVYNAPYTVAAQIGSSDDHQPILSVAFSEPFVYTGGNLRISLKTRSTQYASATFEVDNNYKNQSAYRRSDGVISETASYTISDLPVAYFSIDKEASTISGTVTSAGDAVADAAVKLVSGIVEYSGTTDADGKYSIAVCQDKLTYTMTVAKDGYFTEESEVALNGASLVKDVTLDAATGFRFKNVNIPESGEVNSRYTATITLLNGAAKAEGSYTVEFYANDGIVGEGETPALAEGEVKDYTFSFVPHETGTVPVYVKVTYDDGYIASDEVSVTIAQETASTDVVVGTENTVGYYGPIDCYHKLSKTEIIYPKSLINLPAGTKINSISFYGTLTYGKNAQFSINAYIGNVAEGTALKGESTEGMTQISNISPVDATNGFNNEPVLTLPLENFVYDGGDIRIYTESTGNNWASINFALDNTVKNQGQYMSDDTSLDGKSWTTMDHIPVAHFAIAPYKTLSGIVLNSADTPVANAYVTLTSDDDVVYQDVTSPEGTFSVEVLKYNKSYTLTVENANYDKYTHSETISLADGNIEGLEIVLSKEYEFSGQVVDAATQAPIEGAKVKMVMSGYYEPTVNVTTDAEGKFSGKFKTLWTYNITVTADGYEDVFYEDVEVDGDLAGTLIEMTKKTYVVNVVIADASTFAPLVGVAVSLDDPQSGTVVAEATTDEKGFCTLTVEKPGSYNMLATLDGYDKVVRTQLVLTREVDARFYMSKTVYTVSGIVSNVKTSAPIEGATVALYNGEIEAASATTDATGAFSLELEAKGTYKVVVKAEGYQDYVYDGLEVEYSLEGMKVQMEPESSVGTLTADGLRVYGTTGAVVVESSKDALVRIYNTAGSLIRSEQVAAGKTKIDSLNRGIYVVNGVKVIVK